MLKRNAFGALSSEAGKVVTQPNGSRAPHSFPSAATGVAVAEGATGREGVTEFLFELLGLGEAAALGAREDQLVIEQDVEDAADTWFEDPNIIGARCATGR